MSGLKLWIISICLILFIVACSYFSDILMLFAISAVVAFLLFPLVDWLQKKAKIKRRWIPTLIVFLIAFGILAAAVVLLVPVLFDQISSLLGNISEYASTITDFLDHLAENLVKLGLPGELLNIVEKLTATFENFLVNFVANLGTSILEKSLKSLDVIIFFCLTFYFMLDGRNIYRAFVGLFHKNGQDRIGRIARELNVLVWSYLKQHIVISGIMALIELIGFLCFGLESALLLALIAFFLDFIPYIGSIVAGLVAGGYALVTGSFGLAIWVLIFVIATQQVEGNIIMPKFQGKSMDVHPLAIIFSLLACNRMWGVFGMFISAPLAGLVKVLLIELRDLYRSIDRPGGFGSPDPNAPLMDPSLVEDLNAEKPETQLDKVAKWWKKRKKDQKKS